MVARRHVLTAGAASGAALLISPGTGRAAPAPTPTPTPTSPVAPGAPPVGAPPGFGSPPGTVIDSKSVAKYVTRLLIPRAMPPLAGSARCPADEYRISVRQFRQQILPPGQPITTVWGYGSPSHPGTFHYPGCTIEARVDRPVQVTWANELVDRRGRFLPHLLPVDPTLHWANPPGGLAERDHHSTFTTKPEPYTGPVPLVTHLHGAHTHEESDGFPEAWYLPVARDIPRDFATVGTVYDEYRRKYEQRHGRRWAPGSATFHYANDQPAAALWYHDHTLGMTRLNIYAGPVGYYLLRGGRGDVPAGVLPGPAPALGDPPGRRYYEIPLIVQDRTFNLDGSLHYPARRTATAGTFTPDVDVPPIWIPNFFGEAIVTNGRTWPVLEVEPRRYRFRLLNACNGRFLLLKIAANPTARPAATALPIWQIGADGGLLPEPVRMERVQLGVAERADVIVDFTGIREGTALYLINEGPDGHFPGGEPGRDFPAANPQSTGQVMKFVVGALTGEDHSVPPDRLALPGAPALAPASTVRRLSLNVLTSKVEAEGPVAHRLGQVTNSGQRTLLTWHSPVTDIPRLGATEIWEFHNFSPDAHPIHVHQVQFQVIGRGRDGKQPPARSERGFKDTVVAYPGHITRVKARFDLPGRYVWHCHVLEHEDNEMMLPFVVAGAPEGAVDAGDGGTAASATGTGTGLAGAGAGLLAAAALGGVVLARRLPADPPPA